MADKRISGGGAGGGGSFLERLPESIINEIMLKLEPETQTLCTLACVSRTLRSSVYQALSSFSSLDLSAFSPDTETLNHIIPRFRKLEKVTLDCLRLNDSSISNFLGPDVQELILLKCSSLSHQVLSFIGQNCPNLRVLTMELAHSDGPAVYVKNLLPLLEGCSLIESLCIKNRGTEIHGYGFRDIGLFLPKTIKVLKLQPLFHTTAIRIIIAIGDSSNILDNSTDFVIPFSPGTPGLTLKCLSLVLDIISDELIISIANSLPLLAELHLEDRPGFEPISSCDLTNSGLQSLGFCRLLTSLSLIRGRQNYATSFKQTSDMGMFLLSEGCRELESVRLGGFSKVSDAGFISILNSCQNLKTLEIRHATLLSDLAFSFTSKVRWSLVEVKLSSCTFITSESVEELASSRNLEVLDLFGCKSVADSCLGTVSRLSALTSLNLGGADVTDSGMAVLGKGSSPITRLGLRGCKRVSDKGVTLLLNGGGEISKTLSSLDIGHMPGISDRGICSIAANARAITELCIRYCYYVTDASLKVLASERVSQDGSRLLRKLDLYHCIGLSVESLEFLKKPLFPGLQWVGLASTRLIMKGDAALADVRQERPWLTLCLDGCEMGCHDGWQFH